MSAPRRSVNRRYWARRAGFYRELRVQPDRPGWQEVAEVNSRVRGAAWGASYGDVIATEEWRATARRAKKRHPRCWVCQSRGRLEVHHLTYERVQEERDGDLVVLCRVHHDQVHELSKIGAHKDRSFAWILAKMKADRLFGVHSEARA